MSFVTGSIHWDAGREEELRGRLSSSAMAKEEEKKKKKKKRVVVWTLSSTILSDYLGALGVKFRGKYALMSRSQRCSE